ncbi:arabinan endo-1,5-alpha-L-arabinosidase [Paraflavitalea pollutisoli]|uniref:arabinan endo-1,5-alpha-L-arabinosidase n=1 Tax=Paraflavitalea pollutisoli TaxID=3034143 RepID=UPI0023EA7A9F|nr:arabinan endo-1,5-alpha-L-arabinosidase [Paraflavitalea sp. H1-2-19X]
MRIPLPFCLLAVALLLATPAVQAQQPAAAGSNNIQVHDPVMIKQDDTYYLFCTGRGISVWSSKDRKQWQREKQVFDTLPWGVQAVKGFRNHIWAPDISYHNGTYYLFYSVSAFGKNTSCIGLATNKTLHPGDPAFKWVDHGKVIESVPGRDMWNAIDPNVIWDDKDQPWLAFGSFWNGLKMVKLNASLTAVDMPQQWHSIASRKLSYYTPDSSAGDGAIEAPFVFKKGAFYYLFASTDYCCKGAQSTYKMIVGRSASVTGPYVDKAGVPLLKSGGTLLLEGDKDWNGVGHNAVCTFDGTDYLIFHGYDANDRGRSKLRIETLAWKDGWPEVAK